MDGAAFRERVTEAKRTELARLGSGPLLLALTHGEPTARRVLEAAADSEHAAHTTFSRWADDEDDQRARRAFAAVADREREHRERVLAALPAADEAYEPNDGGLLHEYLRGRVGAIRRAAAGMVGRGLVVDRTHSQVISFFVDEGAAARVELFRDLREETEAGTERGLDLLETLCANEDDWADARAVAEYTVQIAYDDYADGLRGLEMDPASVC
ncbi:MULTISPECIES: rubrerythrin family protein [Halolamina]|uniref:Rubrerythrin n=1 Tax=Halolamina pelagica TaxID=699431 RepID=A0A1I5QUL0_9EURY|nr:MULTISPECIES: rubrerythrin family protein [Halolamina]NHX35545.1 rubrerythrin family protein [Halolamina sp. R1-12]SFP49820.1 hypothetical protein SAMN05216277_10489 [Halolamina pelagica]